MSRLGSCVAGEYTLMESFFDRTLATFSLGVAMYVASFESIKIANKDIHWLAGSLLDLPGLKWT